MPGMQKNIQETFEKGFKKGKCMNKLYIYLGLLTVFISAFSLFFIFNGISKMLKACEIDSEAYSTCGQLNRFSLTAIIALLVISGFIIVISVTSSIMISSS